VKQPVVYCPGCGDVRGRSRDVYPETARMTGTLVLVFSHHRQTGASWETGDACPGGTADLMADRAP
jgi:hypothetical protein